MYDIQVESPRQIYFHLRSNWSRKSQRKNERNLIQIDSRIARTRRCAPRPRWSFNRDTKLGKKFESF